MTLHIVEAPPGLEWFDCVHKPTRQRAALLTTGGTVETQHGTMSFRAGDILMEGVNGAMYALSPEAFFDAYEGPRE